MTDIIKKKKVKKVAKKKVAKKVVKKKVTKKVTKKVIKKVVKKVVRKRVKKEELKPCPHCGHTPILEDRKENCFYIGCHCGANVGYRGSKKILIKAWNTRVNDSCLKENKGGESGQENAKLLQEIRTLTNERVEFREEIKRLNIEIIFDLGGILKRDPRSSKVEELISKYKEGE